MRRLHCSLGAAVGAALPSLKSSTSFAEDRRFSTLPPKFEQQLFQPETPYPNWDTNWDHCKPGGAAGFKTLGRSENPSTDKDFKKAIRQLFAEAPYAKRKTGYEVEAIIKANADDIPGLFFRTLFRFRGANRHVILVRHGQYEEGEKEDEKRVLTPLGRKQAEATGHRIAEMLRPVFETEGRGAKHVRIHVSTMQRARETAEIIARQLPEGTFERLPPSPLLVEGAPPAHNIPDPMYSSRDVHTSLMEVGFRSVMYRLPLSEKTLAESTVPRDEYDIVVCHANVIRFFSLRALQLPPEAWFRVHPNNCSITHLRVDGAGDCDLFCFGDAGHLSIDDSTSGMIARYPFK